MLTECILMLATLVLFALVYYKRGVESEQLADVKTAEDFSPVAAQSSAPSVIKDQE
jgi:hypothetical protein